MTQTANNSESNAASSRVWMVRGGAQGQDEALALETGLAIIGFSDIPDLTGAVDRAAVLERIRQANPASHDNRNRNRAGQLNAFLLSMRNGDIVALPLKTRPGRIALGRVTGPYHYQLIDGAMRHTRPVEWTRPDVPRSDFEQDLLNSLGAFLTICRIKRNGAGQRIATILNGSVDPARETTGEAPTTTEADVGPEPDAGAVLDIAQTAREQILDHIRSFYPGHKFASLVEAVLQAEGFYTSLSPPGPDGGVDILAGRGSLGFEGQKLCVQVKATAKPTDVKVLRALIGTMQQLKADRGLLVSWGGFTGDAVREARQSFFTVRLWHANNLVDEIFRNYQQLPGKFANEIPLKQIWTLVRGDDE